MSKRNALYWRGYVIDAVEDWVTQEAGPLVYGLSRDPSGLNFAVEGDSAYRIEVRVFELKEGE